MNPDSTPLNQVSVTYFTSQNRPPKKVGATRHFQASWASQPKTFS